MSTELLRQSDLFRSLSDAQLESVLKLLRERRYSAGETVVKEGEQGQEVFLVRSGQVSVSKAIQVHLPGRGELGFEKQLAVLGEGSYFGEVALLVTDTRSATVKADTELDLWVLTTEDMRQLMDNDVELGYRVLSVISRELCNRLQRANEDIRKLVTAFAFALNR